VVQELIKNIAETHPLDQHPFKGIEVNCLKRSVGAILTIVITKVHILSFFLIKVMKLFMVL